MTQNTPRELTATRYRLPQPQPNADAFLCCLTMVPACLPQFSGQCHCHPGFGGRQCTECEQFHWGDPRVLCQGEHPSASDFSSTPPDVCSGAGMLSDLHPLPCPHSFLSTCAECNCHPLGSEVAQCDRGTGKCKCKDGMAGRQCDQCARGFLGVFPTCARCHPCFQLWDDTVRQLRWDLECIQEMVKSVVESSGTPGFGDMNVKRLEMKLMQVKDLLSGGESQQIHRLIGQSIEELRSPAHRLRSVSVASKVIKRCNSGVCCVSSGLKLS